MLKYSRLITLIGGILAFFSFALPWDNEISGAEFANTGEDTLVIIAIIAAIGLCGISIYMLNRYTTWQPMSKITAVIISGMALFFYILICDTLVSTSYASRNSRLSAIAIIFILAISLFGISIYVSNRHVYMAFWRIGLALVIGSIGILSCFFLIILGVSRETNFIINFIMIDFIAAVTIIGFSIFMLLRQPPWKSWSTRLVLLSSSIGLCCFFILFLADSLHLKFEGDFLIKPRYGAFLTAIGYILAIIGVFGSLETINKSTTQDMLEEVTPEDGEE